MSERPGRLRPHLRIVITVALAARTMFAACSCRDEATAHPRAPDTIVAVDSSAATTADTAAARACDGVPIPDRRDQRCDSDTDCGAGLVCVTRSSYSALTGSYQVPCADGEGPLSPGPTSAASAASCSSPVAYDGRGRTRTPTDVR